MLDNRILTRPLTLAAARVACLLPSMPVSAAGLQVGGSPPGRDLIGLGRLRPQAGRAIRAAEEVTQCPMPVCATP